MLCSAYFLSVGFCFSFSLKNTAATSVAIVSNDMIMIDGNSGTVGVGVGLVLVGVGVDV
jgi:hypothetical protein